MHILNEKNGNREKSLDNFAYQNDSYICLFLYQRLLQTLRARYEIGQT